MDLGLKGRKALVCASSQGLGLACATRDEVDRLSALARAEGVLRSPPVDGGEPVGYWAYVADPDGNKVELYEEPR